MLMIIGLKQFPHSIIDVHLDRVVLHSDSAHIIDISIEVTRVNHVVVDYKEDG